MLKLRTAKFAKNVSSLAQRPDDHPVYSDELPSATLRHRNGKRIPRYMVDPENATTKNPWDQSPTHSSIRLFREATQPVESRGTWDVRHDSRDERMA